MAEKTFSLQSTLPKLKIPDLDKTLDRYLAAALVELPELDQQATIDAVEEFRKSALAAQLQQALQARADKLDNWLEDWWYDAYCEVREPLTPFLSLASRQNRAPRNPGSQVCRAADATYEMLKIWQMHRKQTYPIMKSRGTVWDMNQNYVLYNANRVPALPKDRMARYFKTEDEGDCPSNLIVLCRGNVWSFNVLRNNELKSVDEFYNVFQYILQHSTRRSHAISSLTALHRDKWAELRLHLQKLSSKNKENLAQIESSIFVVALTDDEILDENEFLVYSMCGRAENQWADKSMNIHIMKDGQISTQADHSNADAIVVLDAGNMSGKNLRHHKWLPKNDEFEKPCLLNFTTDDKINNAIEEANKECEKNKTLIGVKVLRYNSYGNDQMRKFKVYMDTVVQIAMQLAYAKTHGSFAPIYETASTRKFYHGRTETIRGRTNEVVAFGKALLKGAEKTKLAELFQAAYAAHNKLMAEAMEAQGFDRHLYGLRKTLEEMNKGACSVKRPLPKIFTDKAWKHSGGDGSFKLSTSFIGYDKFGTYGYVCAMCPDGYGSFYKIHDDSLLLTATNFNTGQTDLEKYTQNIAWALDQIGDLLGLNASKI